MKKISTVTNGSLLIAEPFLGDSNFERSVVLVCEHSDEGTFGLVLNQTTNLNLSDVIDDVYAEYPLFLGGPVQQNTLHYLHRRPDLIDGSIRVGEGLFWSGDFEQVKQAINIGTLPETDIRFFVGYSGYWRANWPRKPGSLPAAKPPSFSTPPPTSFGAES
jgi:putative transcriptional regulator